MDKYCKGCNHNQNERCDVLGEVNKSAIKICKLAGYKLIHIRLPYTSACVDHRAILRHYGLEGWE